VGELWGQHGNTAAWQALRAMYGRALPLPCWRCRRLIMPGDRWHLGHVRDRALGGGDDRLAPEHELCSARAGARTGHLMARVRRRAAAEGRPMAPSVYTLASRRRRARLAGRAAPSRDW
jgi:hypothetical protein